MITGDDFVMVVAVDPMVLVRDFLQEWSSRWPNMCVAPGGNPDAGFESWPQAASRVSVGEGDVLVARDRQMESEWSEKGYFLTSDGEGPFAIFYSPCPRRTTRVLALQDPYDRGDDFQYEPYELTLVGARLSFVTVVTAHIQHAFTTQVLETLVRCCRLT